MSVAMQKILVPVDFSDPSRLAVTYAAELAQKFGGRVQAVHVTWWPPAYVDMQSLFVQRPEGEPADYISFAKEAAQKSLEEWLAKLPDATKGVIDAKCAEGEVAQTLLEMAKDYDLVVMGTHGRKGFAHALIGSVAEKVVRQAPCPVLTVRTEAKS